MSTFDAAILTVLKHEGLFVNDPHDPGGATNYGVSLRWLKSIGDLDGDGFLDGDLDFDGDVDIDDIKNMTKEAAIKFYRIHWWNKNHYEQIHHQSIATKALDLSINMGSRQAHKCLQRAVRAATRVRLIEDGIFGTKTFTAINTAIPQILLASFRSEAAGFYRALNKSRYLEGWLNRAYA